MLLNYLIRHTKIRKYTCIETIIYSMFSNFEPIFHRLATPDCNFYSLNIISSNLRHFEEHKTTSLIEGLYLYRTCFR